jgi:leucyl-tRNA synthetase
LIINKLIKGVTDDFGSFKYNTVIAKIMESLNKLSDFQTLNLSAGEIETLIKIIAPLAPYTAEELWSSFVSNTNGYTSVHLTKWPVVEEKYLIEDTVKVAVAINGKVRDQLTISNTQLISDKEIFKKAKELEKIKKWIRDSSIVKEIYIPNKMINLVIK